MKLSVVMAVHNGERYLGEAVESVLAQSMADFEFLIVDDASTDRTPEILSMYRSQDPRLRTIRNEQQLGPFPSANVAIGEARGRYIARHDADDLSHPERFARQLAAIDNDPEVSMVSGPLEVFQDGGTQPVRVHYPCMWQPRLEWELLFANAGGTGANVMFPRVFKGTPIRFPATQRYAEDYGLWCSSTRIGRVISLTDVLYRYRQHATSISSSRRLEQDRCAAQIRQAYQSHYLPSGLPAEAVAEVVRFWNHDGSRPFGESIRRAVAVLTAIRSDFLAYAEQRYGSADRSTLETQLEEAVSSRLAYWLFRSMRFLDAGGTRALLAMAGARGESVSVGGKALSELAGAALRKVKRPLTS